MSINDHVMELEEAARAALFKTNAIKSCEFHEEVTIRVGDTDAEKHAYAIATNELKRTDRMFVREELMDAIQHELDMAADSECPECAHLRDSA